MGISCAIGVQCLCSHFTDASGVCYKHACDPRLLSAICYVCLCDYTHTVKGVCHKHACNATVAFGNSHMYMHVTPHLLLNQQFVTGMHVMQGRTCLHHAVYMGDSNLVQLLLQHHPDVSAKDNEVCFISTVCVLRYVTVPESGSIHRPQGHIQSAGTAGTKWCDKCTDAIPVLLLYVVVLVAH